MCGEALGRVFAAGDPVFGDNAQVRVVSEGVGRIAIVYGPR